MRSLLRMALLTVGASVGIYAADPSIGTWKLNVEKSKISPAPMALKSQTTTREAIDGGAKVTTTGVRADGTPFNSSGTVKYDGTNTKVTGAPWDTIAVKQVDANTFTAVLKHSNGKFNGTSRTVISKDGRTMTITAKGINENGEPFTATLVYDKQ